MEQIADLAHSRSQLKELTKEMRQWLDVADEEISELRSQNTSMTKHIKRLEKLLSEKAHNEAESSGLLRGEDLDADKINAQKMNKMEKEAALMMEETQKLTAEMRSLQEQKEKDQAHIRDITTDLETFKCYIEQGELEQQQKDEIIHQRTLQLIHFEKTVGEYTNIVEDLRLTNQELKRQLEEALERTSIAALNEPEAQNERALSSLQSIAQEIQATAAALMEENQKLTAEIRSLQEEKLKDQAKQRDITADLKTVKEETEPEDQTDPTVVHQHYQRPVLVLSESLLSLRSGILAARPELQALWAGSYLWGSYLWGPYRGSYLCWPYLWGSYLWGPYLWGPYLWGPYLREKALVFPLAGYVDVEVAVSGSSPRLTPSFEQL
ncbi:outer dense fiber protein 2-like [Gouania willdenowi]|uniref:outer dense fiber protein 2-like n=1 Tax=Gouania willdenowi TaxID=441366 RepID=UPI001054444D|nr:outer dense fiber protein 2-like [Gouania willdenowi]